MIGFALTVIFLILGLSVVVWKCISSLARSEECDHEYFKVSEGPTYIMARCFKCNDRIKITWRYGKR